ncbi:hypothetical protein CRG98_045210 [Punica granatum]|uniref:Nucleotide-diphospho-sugar transferase domain-containing protein n=1 Tax=Punica granatum TaxID=22663 RepID=A0A2I0HRQ3_PUNGR|nr:hypothetical protein CRG98_045210 [Punica granatum]
MPYIIVMSFSSQDLRTRRKVVATRAIRNSWRTAKKGTVSRFNVDDSISTSRGLKQALPIIDEDIDVIWFRNPFAQLSGNETEDLQISIDVFNGNPWSEKNLINTDLPLCSIKQPSCLLVQNMVLHEGQCRSEEQDVLLDLTRRGTFRVLGLKARFLDTLYFSRFCTDSRDFGSVTTTHAYCRIIVAKIFDLRKVLRD